MSRNIKEAMSRLGERVYEPVPEPEPLKDEARNEQIELLIRFMGQIDYALFTDEQIEQMYNAIAQNLKGKQRDRWGREQMYINRTRKGKQIRTRTPVPEFVCRMHTYIVSENKRIETLNRKMMTEQDYNNAISQKDGCYLFEPIPYPNAWKAAQERALHIETTALLDEWNMSRRWNKNVSEGRVLNGTEQGRYKSAIKIAQSEVME